MFNFFENKEEGIDFSFEDIDQEIKHTTDRCEEILKNSKLTKEEKKRALEGYAAYLYNMVYRKMKPYVWKKKGDVEAAFNLIQEEIKNIDKVL